MANQVLKGAMSPSRGWECSGGCAAASPGRRAQQQRGREGFVSVLSLGSNFAFRPAWPEAGWEEARGLRAGSHLQDGGAGAVTVLKTTKQSQAVPWAFAFRVQHRVPVSLNHILLTFKSISNKPSDLQPLFCQRIS